ncbi:glycoside hydrolase family 10 protein [Fibrella forsythiae]|uniref:Family 10 glycosylhydrolase n=1 Tax=Fibrella forsythiae TaxID=2817061 RepID=A0ABS3JL13_9BACT|nr:family 10 glycosylhydrolase [Fibrella forsythiae]MBO0949592.1 family 10 glycosylhydrolase [Fibrella forsythiae]
MRTVYSIGLLLLLVFGLLRCHRATKSTGSARVVVSTPSAPTVVSPPTPTTIAVAKIPPRPVPVFDTLLLEPPLDAGAAAPIKREFRAVWIATVDNIDWPSKKGLPVVDQQREFMELLDMSQQTGLNAVVVQVRAAADAFYAKSAEPWSEWLTGQQGLAPDPFYDPMEFMIREARSRNLEFHAWLNLDRATFSKTASVAPTNISYQRPGWMVEYGGRKLFNLGLPEVRAYVAGTVANIVRNYDVDGIHFDDYFYPFGAVGQSFADGAAFQAYNTDGLKIDDWRRQNIDKLIRQIGDSIHAVKPWVKFGISPFGIWKNQKSDPDGSVTFGGQAYYDLYADIRRWAREDWIDYMVPQIYFSTRFDRANYKTLVDWWVKNRGNHHLYIGQGAYRLGKNTKTDTGWGEASQLADQMRHNRQYADVTGSVFFSAKSLKTNMANSRDSLRLNFYQHPALIPTMPWLDAIPPGQPQNLKAAPAVDGVELFWQEPTQANELDRVRCYVIYRTDGIRLPRTTDPRRILTICRPEEGTRLVDRTADPKKKYTYVITAMDRLHNESNGSTLVYKGGFN